ncbi:uroporphyrinogen decarboxylase [Peptoniphilus koenoeneniae]|uniref:Uroporphyrinogen decarboxylase n=1 Tax=Peptoniphilus koenoeneniae TaxID=507751 RepID=A0ABU0ASX7_9FIRM|nr:MULTISPECIES: uroporphyrinogen decarboxylase family protein [Peptoniphilus]ERT60167.1 uroporphyrinogen decarboxylase [Peptoniphilus sp. BV3C26]MDQ0274377.1 uroporphyrinogen decarboxylase [Peptoniphilus koenoeneniae]
MENKRQLVLDVINGKKTERVPLGFWHHFILGKDQFMGLEDPSLLEKAYKGHVDYYKKTNPDIMKIMNEGFFGYPPIMDNDLKTAEDLKKIKSIGENHPWIQEQVKYIKKLAAEFSDEVLTFYNVFSPLQTIRIRLDFLDQEYDRFVYLAENFPEEFKNAGLEISKDIQILVKKLLTETSLDGIYYCVQNIQSKMYDKNKYEEIVKVSELPVLEVANKYSDLNILHMCGYARYTNDLSFYKNYEARIYNWATFTEKISIGEGKKLFPEKCILGGFDNNPGTLIDKGSKEELEAYTKSLIEKYKDTSFIIGADCSIPNDIDDNQVRIISDATYKFMDGEKNE